MLNIVIFVPRREIRVESIARPQYNICTPGKNWVLQKEDISKNISKVEQAKKLRREAILRN
jgi:hypothetical protein